MCQVLSRPSYCFTEQKGVYYSLMLKGIHAVHIVKSQLLIISLTVFSLLIIASPLVRTMGHDCEDGHEHSSSTAGGEHDDCKCGCFCHTVVIGVLTTSHDAHHLPVSKAEHFHVNPTLETFLLAIERPPRLFS